MRGHTNSGTRFSTARAFARIQDQATQLQLYVGIRLQRSRALMPMLFEMRSTSVSDNVLSWADRTLTAPRRAHGLPSLLRMNALSLKRTGRQSRFGRQRASGWTAFKGNDILGLAVLPSERNWMAGSCPKAGNFQQGKGNNNNNNNNNK